MEIKLRNVKGTEDYLPSQQAVRKEIMGILEEVFMRYGFKAVETPILNYYDILSSKYAGGSEILKEVYCLKDQGDRELALRYDLTVPFAKVIGMNRDLRMPFKRYEMGKVFRDGPVKTGRMREFMQCDVDVVGIKSLVAEAELISMAFDVFKELGLEVYVTYNNRKLLTSIIMYLGVEECRVNDIILTLDKIEKLNYEEIYRELIEKGIPESVVKNILLFIQSKDGLSLESIEKKLGGKKQVEGLYELRELSSYLKIMGIGRDTVFNPFLARGLDIYTGTVYEIFLKDGSINSSIGSGGRYDDIIGKFLKDGKEYPAVGMSFGLDVIFTAMSMKKSISIGSPIDYFVIPVGAEEEAIKLVKNMRNKGLRVEMEAVGRKLKKSFEYADKEQIPYVIVIGEDEIRDGRIKIRDMKNSREIIIEMNDLMN